MNEGLAYIGKIISLEDVPDSDFISCATVVCGKGGKWRGVVKRGTLYVGGRCRIYLPDSLLVPSEEFLFMDKHRYRVRMCKFRDCPSEVLIMPMKIEYISCPVGEDITSLEGVKKYFKQIPLDMQGEIYGEFPQFIPKTDEPNYQTVPDVVESLVGKPYYISQKMDGTSSTAYRYKGHFGVCSRNWELKRDENNALWKIAIDHDLENKLPEGYAIQWETCGPKIQSNMAGLKEIEGFAFNIYDIEKQERLYFSDFNDFTDKLMFPICRISGMGEAFNEEMMHMHAERLTYDNGQPHEGVVVRSQDLINGQHISFKCINLNYEN